VYSTVAGPIKFYICFHISFTFYFIKFEKLVIHFSYEWMDVKYQTRCFPYSVTGYYWNIFFLIIKKKINNKFYEIVNCRELNAITYISL
jgi:hypothetical protein